MRMYFAVNTVQIEVDALLLGKTIEANESALARRVFVDMAIHPAGICQPWYVFG